MARAKRAEVWALWRDRLRRFQGSELTVAAFCDWEDVSPAAFYVWRRKLQADSRGCSQKTAEGESDSLAAAPAFVQILQGLTTEYGTAATVVMTLADGTRVDFPATDRELIAHVVLALAATRSAARSNAAGFLQAGER